MAFCSRKLNEAQTRCTTAERELLSIVETLKEFRMILLGHKIIIWTDHKNLIHNDLKSERVLRWHLLMEECGPDIRYVKGPENTVADALSRLPTTNDPEKPHVMPSCEKLADCFAENAEENWSFPASVTLIKSYQQLDLDLVQKAASNDPTYARLRISIKTCEERFCVMHMRRVGLAVCLSVARSSHFLRFLTLHLTQTPSCGPTGPIGQNVLLLSPSAPFRLTLTKFSDFQCMTGSTAGASNRFYENIEKLAIATLKSAHRVTVRPIFFAHFRIVS
jgi:hypothetical protein